MDTNYQPERHSLGVSHRSSRSTHWQTVWSSLAGTGRHWQARLALAATRLGQCQWRHNYYEVRVTANLKVATVTAKLPLRLPVNNFKFKFTATGSSFASGKPCLNDIQVLYGDLYGDLHGTILWTSLAAPSPASITLRLRPTP